jgi:excisionase family DNA binding protein
MKCPRLHGIVGFVEKRFLQLPEVAEVLDVSLSQVYALVRSRRLRAVKIGGRGQYRVEASELEDFIQRCYAETDAYLQAHPFSRELAED